MRPTCAWRTKQTRVKGTCYDGRKGRIQYHPKDPKPVFLSFRSFHVGFHRAGVAKWPAGQPRRRRPQVPRQPAGRALSVRKFLVCFSTTQTEVFLIHFYSWWKSVPLNGIQMLWVNTVDSLVTSTKESFMLVIFPKFMVI